MKSLSYSKRLSSGFIPLRHKFGVSQIYKGKFMQQVCLLFAGRRGLDDFSTRHSVLRIPEVSRKLKTAQIILDNLLGETGSYDLLSHTMAADDVFSSQPSMRSLIAATVQVGLFDRFVRFHNRPQYLIGHLGGASALKVCSQQISLEEFISECELVKGKPALQEESTLLTGLSLEEYGAAIWNSESGLYEFCDTQSKDAIKIIETLSNENLINQCIHVGPCFDFHVADFKRKGLYHVPSLSSIDMDPILNSFWKSA